jgi:hypothetical protein
MRKYNPRSRAIQAGYRSGLEEKIQEQLRLLKCRAEYEPFKIPYMVPASAHTYTPDFVLPNGIVIETKGRWDLASRKKHKLLKEQYPELDLRMVFSNSKSKISKGAKSRYCDVCDRMGIPYADKEIPTDWIKEPANKKSQKAIALIRKGKMK